MFQLNVKQVDKAASKEFVPVWKAVLKKLEEEMPLLQTEKVINFSVEKTGELKYKIKSDPLPGNVRNLGLCFS